MIGPITGETPAIGPSGELGIDARRLMNADVSLVVDGTGRTADATLRIELFDGPAEVVPVPDRFVDNNAPSVDIGALIDWLEVESVTPGEPTMTPRVLASLTFGARADAPDGTEDSWLMVRPGEFADSRGHEQYLGRFPGFESQEAMMAGAVEGSTGSAESEPESAAVPPTMNEDDAWGCLGFLTRNVALSFAVGVLAVIALVGGLLWLGSDDDGSETSVTTSKVVEGGEEETAEEFLRRAVDELIESGTAAVEQTLTVTGGSGDDTGIAGAGVVDYDASDAQLSIDVSSVTGQTGADGVLDVYLTDSTYAFSSPALTPEGVDVLWVEASPGEIDGNEDVERLGLNATGIGETFNPVAMTAMAAAAEDAVEQGDGSIEATVTLPVEGPAADHVDNAVRSVYGVGQDSLAGLGIKLTFTPSVTDDDRFIQLEVEMALDDARTMLDDAQAQALAGVVITTRTVVTDIEVPEDLPGRDAEIELLTVFLARYP